MTKQLRIVVRSPNWIGDHVMAIPFYRALREVYPGAEVSLLCPQGLEGLEVPKVFSRVLPISPDGRKFPGGAWRTGKKLRAYAFDIAITLPASWSAALTLFSARIPTRLGFQSDGSDLLLTEALPWRGRRAGLHKSELYLELLRWLSGKQSFAAEAPAGEGPRKKTIVVAPGASISLREWPHFPQLLLELKAKYPDYRLAVVGGPREKAWHTQLRRWGTGIEDLVEKTSLEDLGAMMKTAAVVIANDSGLAHVAATLAGAPTIVLLGPGDPAYILPRGRRVEGLRVALPCSPCESAVCRAPYGYQKCLRSLPVDAVLAATERALSL